MNANSGAEKTKCAAGTKTGAHQSQKQAQSSSKEMRVLAELLKRPLHRFEAERIGDHCLHSTISGLQRQHGLRFERRWTRVPTRFDVDIEVKTYWIAPESREQAERLVRERLGDAP